MPPPSLTISSSLGPFCFNLDWAVLGFNMFQPSLECFSFSEHPFWMILAMPMAPLTEFCFGPGIRFSDWLTSFWIGWVACQGTKTHTPELLLIVLYRRPTCGRNFELKQGLWGYRDLVWLCTCMVMYVNRCKNSGILFGMVNQNGVFFRGWYHPLSPRICQWYHASGSHESFSQALADYDHCSECPVRSAVA